MCASSPSVLVKDALLGNNVTGLSQYNANRKKTLSEEFSVYVALEGLSTTVCVLDLYGLWTNPGCINGLGVRLGISVLRLRFAMFE